MVAKLSRQLVLEYGNSFSEKSLRRMMQFAEVFPDEQIVVTLLRQLGWSHFLALILIKDPIHDLRTHCSFLPCDGGSIARCIDVYTRSSFSSNDLQS